MAEQATPENATKIKQNALPDLTAQQQEAYNEISNDLYILPSLYATNLERAERGKTVAEVALRSIKSDTSQTSFIHVPENSTDHDSDAFLIVEGTSARDIRNRITQLQNDNPSILKKHNLESNESDNPNDTIFFLKRLQQQLQETLGIKSGDLQNFLTHIWALQESDDNGAGTSTLNETQLKLAETSALLNFMTLAEKGSLPSGAEASEVKVEKPWVRDPHNIPFESDRFFNPLTYEACSKGTGDVPSTFLFNKDSFGENTQAYERLLKAAENLGIDPSERQTFNIVDVGKIAKEVMLIQAQEQWCDFEGVSAEFNPKDIQYLIHSGQFMPDLSNDLYLVETGLSVPPELEDAFENAENKKFFLISEHDQTYLHKQTQWGKTFGELTDEQLQEKATNSNLDVSYVRDYLQSPTKFFAFGSGRGIISESGKKSLGYEMDRQEYLEARSDQVDCTAPEPPKPEEKPAPEVECAVNSAGCNNAFNDQTAPTQDEMITQAIDDIGCAVNSIGPCAIPSLDSKQTQSMVAVGN